MDDIVPHALLEALRSRKYGPWGWLGLVFRPTSLKAFANWSKLEQGELARTDDWKNMRFDDVEPREIWRMLRRPELRPDILT